MKILKAVLFWLASLTWGLPLTLFGAICALVLLVTGHAPHRFHWFIYFEVNGDGWGFEGGPFMVVCKGVSLRLKQHEAGHGLQNIMLGVFMPIISVWSFGRFWYRKWLVWRKKKEPWQLPEYDSIWFEGWATHLGTKYFN